MWEMDSRSDGICHAKANELVILWKHANADYGDKLQTKCSSYGVQLPPQIRKFVVVALRMMLHLDYRIKKGYIGTETGICCMVLNF